MSNVRPKSGADKEIPRTKRKSKTLPPLKEAKPRSATKADAPTKPNSIYPIVLAALTRDDAENARDIAKQQGHVTADEVRDQRRRLRFAFDHFNIFYSAFAGLTEQPPSLFCENGIDQHPLVRLQVLARAMDKAVKAVTTDADVTYGVLRAVEFEQIPQSPNADSTMASPGQGVRGYNSETGLHDDHRGHWRELRAGDLVKVEAIDGKPTIAQVMSSSRGHVVVMLLMNVADDTAQGLATTWGCMASECLLLPTPPLIPPTTGTLPLETPTAEQRRATLDEWLRRCCSIRSLDNIAANQRDIVGEGTASSIEHEQADLTEVINLFHEFISRWERLVDFSTNTECAYIAQINLLIEALDWKLHDAEKSMHCVVASERGLPPRKTTASPDRESPPGRAPRTGRGETFDALLDFVSDVKSLQRRALDYLSASDFMDEKEIVEPFDTVMKNVMSVLGPHYIDEHYLRNDENAKAVRLLLRKRRERRAPPQTR